MLIIWRNYFSSQNLLIIFIVCLPITLLAQMICLPMNFKWILTNLSVCKRSTSHDECIYSQRVPKISMSNRSQFHSSRTHLYDLSLEKKWSVYTNRPNSNPSVIFTTVRLKQKCSFPFEIEPEMLKSKFQPWWSSESLRRSCCGMTISILLLPSHKQNMATVLLLYHHV